MNHLFQPWKIGDLQLENRIVIPPLCQYSANNGKVTEWHRMHWGNMMTSGAGLFIIEATGVSPEGRISPYCLGLWSDEMQNAMHEALTAVRQYSKMPIAIQLAHAGRKASTYIPWESKEMGERQIPPSDPLGWQTIAPSPIPFFENDNPPKEMRLEDIQRIIQAFGDAARRSDAVGIDAIEIHMAHGYLIHEFLSPLSNHRTDNYGGSLENRMRFALEIYQNVRKNFPAHKPVWVRISATDWAEGGWNVEEAAIFCKKLKELGCPVIHVSSGSLILQQKIPVGAGYQTGLSQQIRQKVGIPTIAVGLITEPELAESILATGQADAVAIGRAMMFNPHWPWIAARKLRQKVTAPPQYSRSEPFPQQHIFKV